MSDVVEVRRFARLCLSKLLCAVGDELSTRISVLCARINTGETAADLAVQMCAGFEAALAALDLTEALEQTQAAKEEEEEEKEEEEARARAQRQPAVEVDLGLIDAATLTALEDALAGNTAPHITALEDALASTTALRSDAGTQSDES